MFLVLVAVVSYANIFVDALLAEINRLDEMFLNKWYYCLLFMHAKPNDFHIS